MGPAGRADRPGRLTSPYLRDAWRRASDPDPAAWLIWTVEYGVLLVAQAAQHPPWAALCLAALQLAGTAAVLAVLAVRGGWHFGPGRWVLLGGTVAVMAAWPFAHAPGLAMCLSSVVGAAMVLVMISAYRRPAQRDSPDLAGVHPGRPAGPARPGQPRPAAAVRLPGVLRGHGLRGADRRRARRAGAPDAGAAPALCPAGRGRCLARPQAGLPGWPVGNTARRAARAARPWPAQAVPCLSHPQARPYLSQPLALPDPGQPPAVPRLSLPRPGRTSASRPASQRASPRRQPRQRASHWASRRRGRTPRTGAACGQGSLGSGWSRSGRGWRSPRRGQPSQVSQHEERLRADHRGQVVPELGQSRRDPRPVAGRSAERGPRRSARTGGPGGPAPARAG